MAGAVGDDTQPRHQLQVGDARVFDDRQQRDVESAGGHLLGQRRRDRVGELDPPGAQALLHPEDQRPGIEVGNGADANPG